MNETAKQELEQLLKWGSPREVNTKNGPRILRKAKPTESFWAIWRNNDAQRRLKSAGISVGKNDYGDGDWEVCWWQQLTAEIITERKNAIESSRATDADIQIPCPEGLAYLPFQKAGIRYCLAKFGLLDPLKRTTMGHAKRNLQEDTESTGSGTIKFSLGSTSGSQGKGIEDLKRNSQRSGLEKESIGSDSGKNARSGHSGEASCSVKGGESEARNQLQRRERPTTNTDSDSRRSDPETDGIHSGIRGQNLRTQHGSQSSEQLQNRLCESGYNDSSGVGRSSPRGDEQVGSGQQEDSGSSSTRMECYSSETRKGGNTGPFVARQSGVMICDEMGL